MASAFVGKLFGKTQANAKAVGDVVATGARAVGKAAVATGKFAVTSVKAVGTAGEKVGETFVEAATDFSSAKAAVLGDAVALHRTSYLHVESTVLNIAKTGVVESNDVIDDEKLVMAALSYVLHRMAPGCSSDGTVLRSEDYYAFMQAVTSKLNWGVGSDSWRFVVYMDTHVYFSSSDSKVTIVPIPKSRILEALLGYMNMKGTAPIANAGVSGVAVGGAQTPTPTEAPNMEGGAFEFIDEKYSEVLTILNTLSVPTPSPGPPLPGVNPKFAAVFFLLHKCCLKGAANEKNAAFYASMQPTYKAFSSYNVPHRIAVNDADNHVYAAAGGKKFIEKKALRKHHIFTPDAMITAAKTWLEITPPSTIAVTPAVPPAVAAPAPVAVTPASASGASGDSGNTGAAVGGLLAGLGSINF